MEPEEVDWSRLLSRYLEGDLDEEKKRWVEDQLAVNPRAQMELRAYESSWAMLNSWEDEDPDPGYLSRFWTRLAARRPWWQRLWDRPVLRLAFHPVPVSIALILCAAALVLHENWQAARNEDFISSVSRDELAMVENIELIQDFEILEHLDILEQWEAIQQMESG